MILCGRVSLEAYSVFAVRHLTDVLELLQSRANWGQLVTVRLVYPRDHQPARFV